MEYQQKSIPLSKPTLPAIDEIQKMLQVSLDTGGLMSWKVVDALEEGVRRLAGSKHAVALSSGMSGLISAFAAMALPPGAEVIMPSFVHPSAVQALLWNRLKPVFVDCLPWTLTIDPEEVVRAMSRETAAILPATIFGLPPDIEALSQISRNNEVPIIFDSRHGLGSMYKGVCIGGFGLCEVFSLNSTCVISAIEGGVVTTNDDDLAYKLRCMRNYGRQPDDGEGEAIYNGLSSRMGQFHAAVGLLSLQNAGALVASRLDLVRKYRNMARALPGCRVQELPPDRSTNGHSFTLFIGEDARSPRDEVLQALKRFGIESATSFYRPAHVQSFVTSHDHRVVGGLDNTWLASRSALTLPLYPSMTDEEFNSVYNSLENLLLGDSRPPSNPSQEDQACL